MLRLRASDVAAAAGLNPYKRVSEVVLDNVQRLSKTSRQVERERFTTSLEQSKKLTQTLGSETQKDELEKVETATRKTLIVAKTQKTKKINVLEKTKKSIEQADKLSYEEKNKKFQEIDDMKKQVEEKFEEKVKQVNDEIKNITSTINQEIIKTNMSSAVSEKSVGGSKSSEENVMTKLDDTLDNETLLQMKELATRHVNTNRGINEEEDIINTREKVTGTQITQRNATFYTLIVDDDIKIVGAIDGYSKEEGLVEVKNRRNRFLGMPEYEMVQCEVYMRMLKIEKCVHIERFNGNDKATIYGNDPGLWEKIKHGLDNYREEYYKYLNE